jgi:integrase
MPEELRALLAAAPRHRDLYLVAALSGLRAKELRLLEKRDVDLQAKVWRIRPEVDKTGRPWVVPILPDLARIMLKLPEPTSQPFGKQIGNSVFDEHLKKAKITKIGPDGRRLNFHSLRYFFCTLLARQLPIQVVQRLMRHTDIRRTVNLYWPARLPNFRSFSASSLPLTLPQPQRRNAKYNEKRTYVNRECMGIEPTESFVQTLHWF